MTPHFTLAELTHTDHRSLDNTPNAQELANLQRLAEFLETVKTTLGGKPVMISSAYRSKALNDAVGSRDTSSHRLGLAADFKVPGMAPDAVVRTIIAAKLPYDQIIREFSDPVAGGGWTHISIADKPRRQALIIDRQGTRVFA
jgi:zinc D-Ala-D-Ala carboxypeptidase